MKRTLETTVSAISEQVQCFSVIDTGIFFAVKWMAIKIVIVLSITIAEIILRKHKKFLGRKFELSIIHFFIAWSMRNF